MMTINIKIDWNKARRFFGISQVAPPNYWRFHHRSCGTAYRGCDPEKCPKDHYEKTGEWKPELAEL